MSSAEVYTSKIIKSGKSVGANLGPGSERPKTYSMPPVQLIRAMVWMTGQGIPSNIFNVDHPEYDIRAEHNLWQLILSQIEPFERQETSEKKKDEATERHDRALKELRQRLDEDEKNGVYHQGLLDTFKVK